MIVPFGVAFGILRGSCLVPGCSCDAYKLAALSSCTCGHFPASHKNLGAADMIEEKKRVPTLELPDDENSTDVLIKKNRDQISECQYSEAKRVSVLRLIEVCFRYPQILNTKVTPMTGEPAQVAKEMLADKLQWVVDPSELEFFAELGKGTAAKVYKGIRFTLMLLPGVRF
jgi:hypothetical protein